MSRNIVPRLFALEPESSGPCGPRSTGTGTEDPIYRSLHE